jgi:hypothetical protein
LLGFNSTYIDHNEEIICNCFFVGLIGICTHNYSV